MDPETLLRRRAVAKALSDVGFPTSPATLATLACRGNGPPFQRYGRIPLYQWGSTLEWARSRLGPLMRSTSEIDTSPAILGR
jgi:hypothetical protein